MQNQLQYPQSFPTNSSNSQSYQHKFGSPTHFKTQDRTLPSSSIKHYASNPNLSLELNNLKTSQIGSETHTQSSITLKKGF